MLICSNYLPLKFERHIQFHDTFFAKILGRSIVVEIGGTKVRRCKLLNREFLGEGGIFFHHGFFYVHTVAQTTTLYLHNNVFPVSNISDTDMHEITQVKTSFNIIT